MSLASCGGTETTSTADVTSPSPSPNVAAATCAGDPHAHVYNPDRLKLLADCMTLAGTIDSETPEPDGDFHVRLRLDSSQNCAGQSCVNNENVRQQGGDLILEPVCEHSVTQADAVAACEGYQNPLVLPAVGSHVSVAGPWVLDVDHGWNEIHPLESIAVVPAPTASPSASPTTAPTAAPLAVTITVSTYGSLAATTLPGASCTAKARLPSGRISTAAGLQVTVVAGQNGSVSWSYNRSSTTKPGVGTHTVTCTLGGQTVTASAAFTVA